MFDWLIEMMRFWLTGFFVDKTAYVRKHIDAKHADESDDAADEEEARQQRKMKKREEKARKEKAIEEGGVKKKKKTVDSSATKLKISKKVLKAGRDAEAGAGKKSKDASKKAAKNGHKTSKKTGGKRTRKGWFFPNSPLPINFLNPFFMYFTSRVI